MLLGYGLVAGAFGWLLGVAGRDNTERSHYRNQAIDAAIAAGVAQELERHARASERTAWLCEYLGGCARAKTDIVIDLRDEDGAR